MQLQYLIDLREINSIFIIIELRLLTTSLGHNAYPAVSGCWI